MFFLLYKRTDNGVSDDFPKISDHFPKISEDFIIFTCEDIISSHVRIYLHM